jgi:hypothetical protein
MSTHAGSNGSSGLTFITVHGTAHKKKRPTLWVERVLAGPIGLAQVKLLVAGVGGIGLRENVFERPCSGVIGRKCSVGGEAGAFKIEIIHDGLLLGLGLKEDLCVTVTH